MADLDPIVGNWYQDVGADAEFEVLSVDEDSGVLELRYFDGSVEELDLDDWYRMEIEPAEPSEDWREDSGDDEDEDMDHARMDAEDADEDEGDDYEDDWERSGNSDDY